MIIRRSSEGKGRVDHKGRVEGNPKIRVNGLQTKLENTDRKRKRHGWNMLMATEKKVFIKYTRAI